MPIVDFHEIQFPTKIDLDYSGGPEYNVIVNRSDSRSEQRVQLSSRPFHTYKISSGSKRPDSAQALIAFWHARRGMTYGFRLKDWNDYSSGPISPLANVLATAQPLVQIDTTHWQLYKTYPDPYLPLQRIIDKPVLAPSESKLYTGIQLYLNGAGSPLVEGTDYTVDYTSGLVTLVSSGARAGTSFKANYEFDVPARFDTLQLSMTRESNQSFLWNDIPMVEVYQH